MQYASIISNIGSPAGQSALCTKKHAFMCKHRCKAPAQHQEEYLHKTTEQPAYLL